jgi:hypothetical protein
MAIAAHESTLSSLEGERVGEQRCGCPTSQLGTPAPLLPTDRDSESLPVKKDKRARRALTDD